ncbi:MAG: hypothetical protein ABSH05_17400, partial [Bryobacteraceae bacterium]
MRLFTGILLSIALAPVALPAPELQTISIDQTLSVDRIGDGVMVLKLTLNGEQFQNWQSKYGQNQSLLKRDLGQYVSQYEAYGWDMQVNQMDRIVTITCKFRGAILHLGGGLFEFRVPKAWRGGERHDTTFSFNFIQPAANGVVIQNNVKLTLPASASDFADDKSETGDRVIRYRLPVGGIG